MASMNSLASGLSTVASGLSPAANSALHASAEAKARDGLKNGLKTGVAAKTRGAAEDFEAVFINTMFQQMFSGVGQGPFSGGPGANVWRSFLTDEYAKSFTKAGGLGIADHVQKTLLATQEMK
jgi:Rod binding domain-containing protein